MAKIKIKKGLIITVTALAIVLFVLNIVKYNEWIAEFVFARGFARCWAAVIGRINSIFPFSVFELMVVVAVVLVVIFIVKLIKRMIKKDWNYALNWLIIMSITVLSITILYTSTMTINYYRYPLEIDLYEEDVANEDLLEIIQFFLEDVNELANRLERDENGVVVSPYTDRELAELLQQEFSRLDDKYYNNYVPLAKSMLLSKVMSYNRISGIYFSLTSEPNINGDMHNSSRPFTMAHEIAHSIGVSREDEANLIASYITLTSDNDYIRYCGYLDTFGKLSVLLFYIYSSEELAEFLIYSDYINKDLAARIDYWMQFDSFVGRISSFFNDLYLKFQGQEDGVDSYSGSYTYEVTPSYETPDIITYEITYSKLQKLYFLIYYQNS